MCDLKLRKEIISVEWPKLVSRDHFMQAHFFPPLAADRKIRRTKNRRDLIVECV
jgi:hypothetical protein